MQFSDGRRLQRYALTLHQFCLNWVCCQTPTISIAGLLSDSHEHTDTSKSLAVLVLPENVLMLSWKTSDAVRVNGCMIERKEEK